MDRYEEALEKARELHGTVAAGRDFLAEIFPELRESEDERDERIRKAIVHLLTTVANESYLIDATGFKKEQFLSYLEKQKEYPTNEEMLRTLRVEYEKGVADTIAKYEQKEQKSEWSKKDDEMRISILQEIANIKDAFPKINIQPEFDWLKSLPERFNLQPKEEWSEVELEFRGEKVKVKRPFFRDNKGRGYSTTEQDEEVAWSALRAWCEKKGISLYDLYPKVEWSEEDADILNCCISSIEEAKENRYAYKETDGDTSYDREIDWLKSLRPVSKESLQPHWKPSEEQMGMLLAVINDPNNAGAESCQLMLQSLFADLKKL